MKIYTDSELTGMLDDLESDRIERKQSFSGDTPNDAREAICAFANDIPNHKEPGILFIGVRDNGDPAELPITDELLRNLANIKTDGNILPLPVISVEKRHLKGADVAVITVEPSDMPPVKYKGRIWVRTGPRRSLANEQEERILSEKRLYHVKHYDLSPILYTTIDDLSREYFESSYLPRAFAEDVLEKNNRTYVERLAACRFIHSLHDEVPTLVGLLAVGKDPFRHLSCAYIQFIRFDGLDMASPVKNAKSVSGRLNEMIVDIQNILSAYITEAYDTTGIQHVITCNYPLRGIMQIVINAVLHRNYQGTNAPVQVHWFNDRIEVISPGGPFGEVTAANFGVPGVIDHRNPAIAEVLKNYGHIQYFGTGIMIARQELERNGNPPPEFIVDQSFVRCVMRINPKSL